MPEDLNGRLAEAKLRISVRREAGVGKSEIKLGYIDVRNDFLLLQGQFEILSHS